MAGELGDTNYFYGEIGVFIAWDGAAIVRTSDISAASPVWERIDTGIDGALIDVQYVIDGAAVIGWCLTETALFCCGDLRASSPVWVERLAIETVRAADAPPDDEDNPVIFHGMGVSSSKPSYLILTTGPDANETGEQSYPHAYFWVTHDLGQSWQQIDMDDYLESSGLLTPPLGVRGYHFADTRSLAIVPSATPGEVGTVYCVRGTPAVGVSAFKRVFISTDAGATWAKAGSASLEASGNNRHAMALRAADPTVGRPGYLSAGSTGVTNRPDLYRSSDDYATVTQLTDNGDPVGYGGINITIGESLDPASGRHDDPDHVLLWLRNNTSPNHISLFESNDQGDTWALLWASGATVGQSPAIEWPPDPLVWAIVRRSAIDLSIITDAVRLTFDNFATVEDKSGNLDTLLTQWSAGSGGGFAFPKEPRGFAATLATLLRVEAGRQAAFDEPAAMAVALPLAFVYQDAQEEHIAPWDTGAWTPTVIMARVAQFATFTLRGAAFFETLPLFLEAGFGAMAPTGGGPYTYAGAAAPAAVSSPVPYTFRLGGDNAGVATGSMIQVQDSYLRSLRLSHSIASKVVLVEAEFFGRYVDDNEGGGYQPGGLPYPAPLGMLRGLAATFGLQDAGAAGGAFDDLTGLQCSLLDWELEIETGLRPQWAGDRNALTYCGVTHQEPQGRLVASIRTTGDNYALILTKAQQRAHQELELSFFGAGDRAAALRLTGRWLPKLNAHDRARGEVVLRPTFILETPATQTTTPHWAGWEITTPWEGLA